MPDKIIPSLTIQKLVYGGKGIARSDQGKAVFVPYLLPGEQADVKIVRAKKDYDEAIIEKRLTTAPERRSPVCPVFETCGGCQLQHLSEPGQSSHKNEVVSEWMRQIKQKESFETLPIIASPMPFHYRLRGQFNIQNGRIGFYRAGSHEVVPIESCPLMIPPINHAISFFNEKGIRLLSEAYDNSLPLEFQMEIQSTVEGAILLVFHDSSGRHFSKEKMSVFFEEARAAGNGNALFSLQGIIVYSVKKRFQLGKDFLDYLVMGKKMRVSDRTFVQVNFSMFDLLIKGVRAFSENDEKTRWLELHAGAGFFTLPLSEIASKVTAIESSPIAVEDAEWNLNAAERSNVQMITSLGGSALARLSYHEYTNVFLDPPRTGLTALEILETVRIAPKKILYLSCHPPAFVRDMNKLLNSGYRLLRVQPFDLFPQTGHLEILAEMTLSSGQVCS
ncbi:MAG: 23S rRNA (uracil(1939)-C(5))-methyltransferase RlmD [Nitrospirota bacterium]